jgi:hypothetical protein
MSKSNLGQRLDEARAILLRGEVTKWEGSECHVRGGGQQQPRMRPLGWLHLCRVEKSCGCSCEQNSAPKVFRLILSGLPAGLANSLGKNSNDVRASARVALMAIWSFSFASPLTKVSLRVTARRAATPANSADSSLAEQEPTMPGIAESRKSICQRSQARGLLPPGTSTRLVGKVPSRSGKGVQRIAGASLIRK